MSTKPKGTTKRKAIDIGAPSQKTQPTRKGKKAWRKNVDITDIEAGIEGLREEERVTGSVNATWFTCVGGKSILIYSFDDSGKLQDRQDKDLFEVDVVGDEQGMLFMCYNEIMDHQRPSNFITNFIVRERLKKEKKPLRSLEILSMRSAVPAVSSRPRKELPNRLTPEEKSRLLQKAKRLRQGALNSYLDPKESGSAVVEPHVSGKYDVWEDIASDDERVLKRIKTRDATEYVLPLVQKPKIQVSFQGDK